LPPPLPCRQPPRRRRIWQPASNRSKNACPATRSGKGRPIRSGRSTTADYSYSDANKSSGLVWSEAVFREYIKNPMGQMPGTKMAFPGIKNETEIGNLWAYLKQFGVDGKIK
jgi:hypothetical protein